MAESGVDYKLDSGTLAAVRGAGIGGDARKHLTNAAIAGEAMNIATDVKDQIVEKQEDTAAREDSWDVGFDNMGDRGSWASGELFDQFQNMETTYKDEYLEAVRKGDTKLQKRLLKDQGTRSSSLQAWKGTMETALKIHTEYGWGEVIKGDTPEADRKRKILLAMSKLDSSTKVKMGSDGEMVFNIPGVGDVTRREVDEMVAAGTAPVVREEAFMTSTLRAKDLGESGKSFNENANHYLHKKAFAKELRASPESAVSIMNDIYSGSETSLADDLRAAISNPTGGIQFSVKIPNPPKGQASGDWDHYDGDGDGTLTAADLTDDNISLILKALEKDPKMLAEVAADWQTSIERNIHKTAKDEYDAERNAAAEAAYFKSLPAAEKEIYNQNRRDEAAAEDVINQALGTN